MAVSDIYLLNLKANVQKDKNAVERDINTLKAWGISEDDIQAVLDEAENVKKCGGKHDKAKDALWGRVEVKSPATGVIVETNLQLHHFVDNTENLYQIADVDKLFVSANIPEDQLPVLEALCDSTQGPVPWTVKTVGSPPIPGYISDIGYLIDLNQHTVPVKGYIDNKEGKLRAGQFISASIELPAPPDVVEVPAKAVVEDGQQSVVFVQPDPKVQNYTMRRVELTVRFETTVFVRSKPFAKGEELTAEDEELGMLPKEALHPGERVLESGVNELKKELLDKESQQKPAAETEKASEKSKLAPNSTLVGRHKPAENPKNVKSRKDVEKEKDDRKDKPDKGDKQDRGDSHEKDSDGG